MTRTDAIDLLMLLSALESWALANTTKLPDYLHDRMAKQIETLRDVAINGDVK